MQNIPQMYIRGLPIETKLGKCYFLTMSQYEDIYKFQKLLYLKKEDLYNILEEILNLDKEDILNVINPQFIDEIRNLDMVVIIKNIRELNLYDTYRIIYDYFCGEGTFDIFILSDRDLLIYKIQIMGKLNNYLLNNSYDELEQLKNEDLSIEERKDIENQIKNNKSNENNTIKIQKDDSFYINIIKNIKELGLYNQYNELFNMCFKDEKCLFDKIQTDKELFDYIQLIIDMNCIAKLEDEIDDSNLDDEVKKFNMYDRLLKERQQENITFKSQYASLWLMLGKQPEFLTIYQYNALFEQSAQFKSFDATTGMYSNEVIMWCADGSKTNNNKKIDDIEDEVIEQARKDMTKVVRDIS